MRYPNRPSPCGSVNPLGVKQAHATLVYDTLIVKQSCGIAPLRAICVRRSLDLGSSSLACARLRLGPGSPCGCHEHRAARQAVSWLEGIWPGRLCVSEGPCYESGLACTAQ